MNKFKNFVIYDIDYEKRTCTLVRIRGGEDNGIDDNISWINDIPFDEIPKGLWKIRRESIRTQANRHLHIAAELTNEANMISDIIKKADKD